MSESLILSKPYKAKGPNRFFCTILAGILWDKICAGFLKFLFVSVRSNTEKKEEINENS